MNITNLISFLDNGNIFGIFFKSFAILFSVIYGLYGLVFYKQSKEIVKTIQDPNSNLIMLIAMAQIIIAAILIGFSIII